MEQQGNLDVSLNPCHVDLGYVQQLEVQLACDRDWVPSEVAAF